MNCHACLIETETYFCRRCKKELFNGLPVSPILSFHSPGSEAVDLFLKHTTGISISGVQLKYSLRLNGSQLELTTQGGEYILKPIPFGQFQYLDQVPANEHLTMQIARQVFKMATPPNAVVFFDSDKTKAGYLVRRFDRKTDGSKLQQEDFAQIAQMTSVTHGENYKYDLSYEEVAGLIKRYIASHKLEIEKFFKMVLFNYVFSNGDAHLKNFSAIQTLAGDYVLTPAYDLLCTRLHSPDESDMALTLFADGFSQIYEAYGFYTYTDFLFFGEKIGMVKRRVEKTIEAFMENQESVDLLIDRSFLTVELKELYKACYIEKIKRLEMGKPKL